jgi:hypothetical protein
MRTVLPPADEIKIESPSLDQHQEFGPGARQKVVVAFFSTTARQSDSQGMRLLNKARRALQQRNHILE